MTRSSGRSALPSTPAALVLLVLFAVLALALWALGGRGAPDPAPAGPAVSGSSAASAVPPAASAVPPAAGAGLRAKAVYVLAVVDATGHSPEGYVGGRQFLNDARGGTATLPRVAPAGARIVYHEYDVNPRRPGVDRGPQRLVIGSDGSAWITGDHYASWQRLR